MRHSEGSSRAQDCQPNVNQAYNKLIARPSISTWRPNISIGLIDLFNLTFLRVKVDVEKNGSPIQSVFNTCSYSLDHKDRIPSPVPS